MFRKIKWWLYKRKRRFQDAVHDELRCQVLGLICIEIDKYLYENELPYRYEIEDNDEIDIHIIDSDFEDNGSFCYPCVLVHLHYEDLLWYVLNREEYNNRIINSINKYTEYTKTHLSTNPIKEEI